MSFAAQLAHAESERKACDSKIAEICLNVSAIDIIHDEKFVQPAVTQSNDLLNLSLFHLNARHVEAEKASEQLNALWLIKALIQEIKISFDPLGDGDYACDKFELEGIMQNIKNLHGRLSSLSNGELAIGPALKSCYDELVVTYASKLKAVLEKHLPQSTGTHVINYLVDINGVEISYHEFSKLVLEFETFCGVSDVTDSLNKYKVLWDKHVLDRLIEKKNYIQLVEDGTTYSLELTEALPPQHFLSRYYFQSVRNFVQFVNLLDNQYFRSYYSTKISNNLVQAISENIKVFMDNREQLTEDLVETLEIISKTNWPMPIRNSFGSLDSIHDRFQVLYLDWINDNYINLVRDLFNSESFGSDLKYLEDTNEPAEEEDDWNKSWDSDDEKVPEKEEPTEEDGWDDGWDEEWDEDAPKPATPKSPHKVAKPKILNAQVKTSPVSSKLGAILESFKKETKGADDSNVVGAITALALISYPPLTDLFLLFNDLQNVKCEALLKFAQEQWRHTRLRIFNEIISIVSDMDLSNNDVDVNSVEDVAGISRNAKKLSALFEDLFHRDLQATNSRVFTDLLLDLLSFINNWVLDVIINASEITEYQSDKFTRVLESVQLMESEMLEKVGEPAEKLTSYNKLKQAIFLINNHLKDIMEYFYQGELYDFSTDELILVIKSVFIPSELREKCITEIMEIRNS